MTAPTSKTVAAIWDLYQSSERQAPRRTHLGASSVGQECARASWYSFRWAYEPEFSGQLLRLFQRGHREEPWLVSDLRRIGVEVLEKDPKTGRQWAWTDKSIGEHFRGSADGALRGLPEDPDGWFLFECKTANAKRQELLEKRGVQSASPTHYNQMQCYMGWSGLRRAAYFSVNKNTDAIYFELVEFDQERFDSLTEDAHRIILSPVPLSRISESPMPPPCCFCDAKALCHGAQVADVNCRTCAHSTPITDAPGGTWECTRHGNELSAQAQQKACDSHLFIPALIPHSYPIEAGDGYVLYQIRGTEKRFANVESTYVLAEFDDESEIGLGGAVEALSSRRVKHMHTDADDWDIF